MTKRNRRIVLGDSTFDCSSVDPVHMPTVERMLRGTTKADEEIAELKAEALEQSGAVVKLRRKLHALHTARMNIRMCCRQCHRNRARYSSGCCGLCDMKLPPGERGERL